MTPVAKTRKRREILLSLFIAAAVFALLAFKSQANGPSKNVEAIKAMDMKTICVGRLLLDVPVKSTVSYRDAGVARWDIYTDAEETDAEFAQRIAEKELSVRGGDPSRRRGGIESVLEIKESDRYGKILIFGRAESFDESNGTRNKLVWISMHAFVRLNGVSYTLYSDFSKLGDLPELRRLRPTYVNVKTTNSLMCRGVYRHGGYSRSDSYRPKGISNRHARTSRTP